MSAVRGYNTALVRLVRIDENARAVAIAACIKFEEAQIGIGTLKKLVDRAYQTGQAVAAFEVTQ